MRSSFSRKKIVIFDLDGTLTESKQPISRKMISLIVKLLERKRIAVVGGGSWEQMKKQFVSGLPRARAALRNLFLFPTNGALFYRYRGGWKCVYRHAIPKTEKKKIMHAFRNALSKAGYTKPKRIYSMLIEDRVSQITFSALGARAPLREKEKWNKSSDMRLKAVKLLKRLLPRYEVSAGGLTSIDVTPKGIDKAFAVREIVKFLHASKKDAIFVGDAIYPGGNDYVVTKTGVDFLKVSGPKETELIIRGLLI